MIEGLVPKDQITKRNRQRSWEYGYNEKYDFVCISKDGTLGEIIEVGHDPEKGKRGLYIGLPAEPKNQKHIYRRSEFPNEQYWERRKVPKSLDKIKNKDVWEAMPKRFKEHHWDFIDSEFNNREYGMWFMNNGIPTYITGKYWFYLNITPLDIGKFADYRDANRILFIFVEACIADDRCAGSLTTKIRRSGWSNMMCSELLEAMTLVRNAFGGMMSKTGDDTQSMFSKKLVKMHLRLPFYFKPATSGNDIPKTTIDYMEPARRITKKQIEKMVEEVISGEAEEEDEEAKYGLMSQIAFRRTSNEAFDSENMERIVYDEVYKWGKPFDVVQSLEATVTTLRKGSIITGKINAGSTMNPANAGGKEGRQLIKDSDISNRDGNGWTMSGLYHIFISLDWNFEGHIDRHGMPVFFDPKEKIYDAHGRVIKKGCIDFWFNRYNSLKDQPRKQNEFVRQNPRFLSHALREPIDKALFPIDRINEQLDYNSSIQIGPTLRKGGFSWENGIRFSNVVWSPDSSGRFLTTWNPPTGLRNRVRRKGDTYFPMNDHIGAFGGDTYDISGVVGGGGSKGSCHGLTGYHIEDAPVNHFFLEYIARPQTAEIFYEDLLMAMHYYGMPILAENNKIGFLKYLKRYGYRGFSINRPDKPHNRLSTSEKELGGVPSSGRDGIHFHANGIEAYINQHVGVINEQGEYGAMYFDRTLMDWLSFDINNREKHDATISSGLAIMAVNRHQMQPQKEKRKISVNFARYDNRGSHSQIIK